jgi:formate hydrogenlyase transcriptional activator
MKRKTNTEKQLLLEREELQTRLDATERSLQEANELLQVQIAERKQAEETLEKAQKYTESIVETIRGPLVVLTPDLRVITANHSFYETFHVTPKETKGRFVYSIGDHAWDIPSLRKLLEEIIPQKAYFNDFEVDHEFPVIGHKIMLLNARRIIQKEIGSQMILLAIEDITERRQLKSLLEVNEAKYRELVQNANSIILKMGPEGKVTFFNEFAQMFFGYTEEEMLGRSVVGTIVPETGSSGLDPDFMIKDIGINPEKYITNENENMRRNGERVWVAWTNKAIRDGNGKVIEILCIGNDITERRQLEILLTESEERYRRLFETADDGILLLEKREGNITHANPAITKMLGYTKEECIGKKVKNIGFSLAVDDFKKIMQELDKKGIIYYDDVPVQTKVGQTLYADIYMVDRARLVQCNIRDISERKRAEEALCRRELELRTALSEIKTLKDQLEAENICFRQEIKMRHQFDHILGQSDGLKYVLYRAEQVAPMNTTVLILGETGTGKDLITAAIHDMSSRKDRPLITVHCAALPANLIESELFGREKGAFTGADTRQVGRFEIAHGSTLCLDEIGELPLELQAKLLRVIQHNEFERLGSSHTIKVDVRIVATTNRNLDEEVRKGRFRQDLYYRLNVFPITVPPLRQRKEDIPLLVQAFIERYSRKLGKQITSISKETMKALQNYPWPGNVRELESIIERAVILCSGPVLQLADKLEISSLPLSSAVRTLEEMERNQIFKTLSETRWRINGKNGAAVILGLHPSTLRARMHKLGILRPETKASD